MKTLGNILGIITIACIGFILYYQSKSKNHEFVIELGIADYRCAYLSANETQYNGFIPKWNKVTIDKESQQVNDSIFSILNYSLRIKDPLNVFEIDLSKANYNQFIELLNICLVNNVKQIILDSFDFNAYLFPTNEVIPNEKTFSGRFYMINSNTLDFKVGAWD